MLRVLLRGQEIILKGTTALEICQKIHDVTSTLLVTLFNMNVIDVAALPCS